MNFRNLKRIDIAPPQKGENPQAFAQIQSKNNWTKLENIIIRENRFEIRGGLEKKILVENVCFFEVDEAKQIKDYLRYVKHDVDQNIVVYNVNFEKLVVLTEGESQFVLVFNDKQECDSFLSLSRDLYSLSCSHGDNVLEIINIEKDELDDRVIVTYNGDSLSDGDKLNFSANIIAFYEKNILSFFFPISENHYLLNHYDLILFGGYQQPLQIWDGEKIVEKAKSYDYFLTENLLQIEKDNEVEGFQYKIIYGEPSKKKLFSIIKEKFDDGVFIKKGKVQINEDFFDCIIDEVELKDDTINFYIETKGEINTKELKLQLFFNHPTFKKIFTSKNFLAGLDLNNQTVFYLANDGTNALNWYSEETISLNQINVGVYSQGDEIIHITDLREHFLIFLKKNIQVWRGFSLKHDSEGLLHHIKTINQGLLAPNLCVKSPAGLFFLTSRGISTFVGHPENQSDISYQQIIEREIDITTRAPQSAYSPDDDLVLFKTKPDNLLCLSLNGTQILGLSTWTSNVDGFKYCLNDFVFWQKDKFAFYKKDLLRDLGKPFDACMLFYIQNDKPIKNKTIIIDQQMTPEKKGKNFDIHLGFYDEEKTLEYNLTYQLGEEKTERKKYMFPFYSEKGFLSVLLKNDQAKAKNVIKMITLYGEVVK